MSEFSPEALRCLHEATSLDEVAAWLNAHILDWPNTRFGETRPMVDTINCPMYNGFGDPWNKVTFDVCTPNVIDRDSAAITGPFTLACCIFNRSISAQQLCEVLDACGIFVENERTEPVTVPEFVHVIFFKDETFRHLALMLRLAGQM